MVSSLPMVEDVATKIRRPQTNGGPEAAPVAGRAMPHSLEAEEYLLSCCLLDGSDTIARCLEARLPPAAFYLPANSLIYEKLCELYRTRPPVELVVLDE